MNRQHGRRTRSMVRLMLLSTALNAATAWAAQTAPATKPASTPVAAPANQPAQAPVIAPATTPAPVPVAAHQPGIGGPARATVDLSGTWDKVLSTQATPAPASGWSAVTLPGADFVTIGPKPQYVWYRRLVDVPASWDDRRVFIDLRGARNAPQVYVDGHLAGQQQDGMIPLRVEVTKWIHPGKSFRLEIRCQDRTATLMPEFVATAATASGDQSRGKTLAPFGGYKDLTGAWERILLETTPKTRIDEQSLAIVPSVRQKTLTLQGTVDAGAARLDGLWIEATVLNAAGKPALVLPAQRVATDASGAWTLTAPFLHTRDWSPEDPYLYGLTITLRHGEAAPGETIDTYTTQFGFKEIWTDGPDFYLNGVKRHLFGAATWPSSGWDDADTIRKRVHAIRDSGAIAFRLHNEPWQEAWLDAADAEGLLIIDEAGVYTDGNGDYAYKDPRFWQNYRDEVSGLIRRDRNHASLAMWSLGNEILFMGNVKFDDQLPKKQGDLARFARTVDATHPYTFEADKDPDGAYDVLGLHYPHELPWHPDYPNTCDWIQTRATTEASGGMLGKQSDDFLWDRKKPLYIGEYLWVPQGDFSVGSIFFGDAAFQDRDYYHHQAQGQSFVEQTIAFRRAGVSGMSPWATFGFGAVNDNPDFVALQKEFFKPVAAFWADYGLRGYGGDTRVLHFDVLNDSPRSQALTLKLRRTDTGAQLATASLTLAAGGYQSVPLTVHLPDAVAKTDSIPVESVLSAGDTVLHREARTFRVFRRRAITAPPGGRLLFYDPTGAWPGSERDIPPFSDTGIAHTILVIPPGAASGASFETREFRGFLELGGRAVVLEQDSLASLGLGLDLVDFPSTMAFPLRAGHPLLNGLAPEDLQFWQPDNYVAQKQIRRPANGGGASVVITGGQNGIDQAPVFDLSIGSKGGRVVLIQALSGARQLQEPAAQRLLQNAIDYLGTTDTTGRTMAISDDPAFAARLKARGVVQQPFLGTSTLAMSDLADLKILAVQGAPAAVQSSGRRIGDFVRQGGTLYWSDPTQAGLDALNAALGGVPSNLQLLPFEGGMSIADREAPLLTGISREDMLYATVQNAWDRPLTYEPHMTDAVFVPRESGAPAPTTKLPIESAELTGGKLVTDASASRLDFDRKGTVTLPFTAEHDGLYRLTLTAAGSPENGINPLVLVGVNKANATMFWVKGETATRYETLVRLAQGQNSIEVRFANGSDWGSPRHLRIYGVEIGQAPIDYPEGVQVLALPGALITWPVGEGRVVLDGSAAWHAGAGNATKTDRYINALFGNLGARFELPALAKAAPAAN